MLQQRPISSKNNRLQSMVNQIIDQQEPQDLLHRITNLWSNKPATEHDQNIMYQRCLYILQLDPDDRTLAQARQVQGYFEKQFHYIGQIRGQLSPELYLKLFKNLLLEKVDKFEMVFMYGEKGKKMYFIMEGEVAILIPQGEQQEGEVQQQIKRFEDLLRLNYSNCKLVALKKKGDHFGEIAIEQRVPRTATVVAKTECTFATLSYDAYQSVLGLLQEEIMKRKLQIIEHIPPFKYWVHAAQYVFLHNCEEVTFETNNIIYKRFNRCDCVYLVVDGEVLVQKWEQFRLDSEEEEIFIPQKERVSTLGLYSSGQIVGDYEVYLTNMEQNYVKRCSQAKCMVRTQVLKVPIQQYIENMKNNQSEEWLQTYFENKFNKKWINQYQISVSPKLHDQYVLKKDKSHLLRKISCQSVKYHQPSPSITPSMSQDLINLQRQNRKYLQIAPRKVSISISTNVIVKQIKERVQNSRDDLRRVNSFTTQLKPSTCKSKTRIKFNSFYNVDQLFKFQKK